MEKFPSQENIVSKPERRFESYEIKKDDLETLQQDVDVLAESELIEKEILEDTRFVTFDSKNLYVITKGEHVGNGEFSVEEISSSSRGGFNAFVIPHRGFIGKSESDYRGARAWLLCDELETTAVNAKKFPNENVLYQPELPQPKEILDVVSMSPAGPYSEIQQGRYNYLTDIIFHEAGHIEYRRTRNWQEEEGLIGEFPSNKQREMFLSAILSTKKLPHQFLDYIIEYINKRSIEEMYPMVIDREAARRYDSRRFNANNDELRMLLDRFKRSGELSSDGHTVGRFLALILEEQFSDFPERKEFVQLVFDRRNL